MSKLKSVATVLPCKRLAPGSTTPSLINSDSSFAKSTEYGSTAYPTGQIYLQDSTSRPRELLYNH